jgi:VIT1/CCC1 family predicted Fe2+/Mn2+ transporter
MDITKKVNMIRRSEITEHEFYSRLSKRQKKESNQKILKHIADVELSHYNFWGKYSEEEFKPNLFKVYFYLIITWIFGLTFGVRLMERNQRKIKKIYQEMTHYITGLDFIIKDENEHEQMHIDEIDEQRLKFIGSIVLGLNDALVEFTGTIAGLSFALGGVRLVALAGIIAGIAASLSMASSEYLSKKQESSNKEALTSSMYTGGAYIITIILMLIPYFLFNNVYICLSLMLLIVVSIIFIFNFYISVAKGERFFHRFLEMISISLGVATISFVIGFVVKRVFGIDL